MEAKRAEIILGYVQQLKTSLGADAFQEGQTTTSAPTPAGQFLYRGPTGRRKSFLGDDVFDHRSAHFGKALFAALMQITERVLI